MLTDKVNEIAHNTIEEFAQNYKIATTEEEQIKTDREAYRFMCIVCKGDYEDFDRLALSYEMMREKSKSKTF